MKINIYIDKKISVFKKKVEYSVRYIFDTLGYEYSIVDKYEDIDNDSIVFLYTKVIPSIEEIKKDVNFKVVFVIPVETFLYNLKNISSIDDKKRKIKYFENFEIYTNQVFESPIYSVNDNNYIGFFEFDILGNFFYLISNAKEKVITNRDRYKRIPDSYAVALENIEVPTVNIMINYLDKFIKDAIYKEDLVVFKKCFWPKNEKKATIFSFEIDSLRKWKFSTFISSLVHDFMYFFKIKSFIKNLKKKIFFLFTNEEPYWNFKEIIVKLEKSKIPATFFFGNKTANSNIDYYLQDKELEEILKYLKKNNHEIAFLADNLSDSETHLKQELINSSKYLFKDLGLKNDSEYLSKDLGIKNKKLAYNIDKHFTIYDNLKIPYILNWSLLKNIGFKHGNGLPFRTYDFKKDKTNEFYQIPLVFNTDSLIKKRKNIFSSIQVRNKIREIREKIEKFSGIMSYSFCISSFEDIHYISSLYDYILDLETNEENFITTASNLTSWWKKRDKVKFNYNKKNQVLITFSDNIEHFSIELNGRADISLIYKKKYVRNGNILTFSNIKKNTEIGLIINKKGQYEKNSNNN